MSRSNGVGIIGAVLLALSGCGGNTQTTVIGPEARDAAGSGGAAADASEDRPATIDTGDVARDTAIENAALDAPAEADVAAPMCGAFTVTAQCTFCGKTLLYGPACGGGSCPIHSKCAGSSACTCDTGYVPYGCDGQICNGQCAPDSWWCRPTTDMVPTCDSAPVEAAGTCRCADGRSIPLACGSDVSCSERCAGCDTVMQDCRRADEKCTVRWDPSNLTSVLCAPLLGTTAAGQRCSLDTVSGQDDCGKGTLCTWAGLLSDGPRCRKLCQAETDCGAGEVCTWYGGNVPSNGLCMDACALGVADGGTAEGGAGDGGLYGDCPAGQWCDVDWSNEDHGVFVLRCRELGTTPVGGTCRAAMDCAAGLTCAYTSINGGFCEPQCHAGITECPAGMVCWGVNGASATGWGVCWLGSDGG
jgi:hypothetical protein